MTTPTISTHPAMAAAAAVPASAYGAFLTSDLYGSIREFTTNGKLTSQTFYIDEYGAAPWEVELAGVNTLSVSTDAEGNKHAYLTTWTFFTGGAYHNEPSLTTVTETVTPAGVSTISVLVTDYYHAATVLGTSGATPETVTQGGFTVTP